MDEYPHALLARVLPRIAPELDRETIDRGESLPEQVDSIDGFAAYVRRAGSAV